MKWQLRLSFALVYGTFLISNPTWAHHGFHASYNVSKRITLKGTISAFEWSNPHAQICFDANDENGAIVNWTAEMNSPGVLAKNGWTRYSLKPGDHIVVTLVPSSVPGAHSGLAGKVLLPNGRTLEGNQGLRP
jgi:hypothetical protein